MRLNFKILIPWMLFSLVLMAGFGLFQWQFTYLQTEVSHHVKLHQEAVRFAHDLRFLSQERLAVAQAYRGGPLAPALRGLEASEARTEALIGQLNELLHGHNLEASQAEFDAQGRSLLDTYALARQSLPALYRNWLNALEAGDALEPVKRLQLHQQYQLARATLDDLAAFHEITQDLVSRAAQQQIERSQWLFYGVMLSLLLAMLGFSFYQGYTVALPLHYLSGAAMALADGRPAQFEISTGIDEINKLSHALRTMLAKLQQSHDEVRQQEERFHRVVQATPIGMVVVNRGGLVVLVNAMAERMFGYEHGRMEGLTVEALVPERFRAEHVGHRNGFLAAPQARYLDASRSLTAQRLDGSEFPVEIGLNPIETAEGAMVLAIVVDITERLALERDRAEYQKRLEAEVAARTAQLQHKTAELELAIKDLESFSYSVSHDLRAPLRAIDGFVEMLLDEHARQLDDDGRRMFGVVQENARKMGQLIDDILAFSRAGRLEMDWQDIDMGELLKEVWTDLASARNGRALELKADPLPHIQGDPRAVRQVLHNLLANAIKFTRTREPGVIHVTATPEGALVRFAVKDNGVGFKPEFANKLFVLFQRLHGMDEFEGTGVGLAIVKRFVMKHGGQVSATAVPDAGATFSFTLPTTVPASVALSDDQPAVPSFH